MPMAISPQPCRGRLDHGLHGGDGALAALQAEALGADELLGAEGLEALRLGELAEDLALLGRVEGGGPGGALDALLDPGLLLGVLDVHELDADRAAIGGAQPFHDLADGGRLQPQHLVDVDRAVEIGLGEAPESGVQLGVAGLGLQAERVELRLQVAAHPVGADEHQRADGIQRRLADGVGVGRDAAGAGLAPFAAGFASSGGAKPPRGRGAQEAPMASVSTARVVVQRGEQLGEGGVHAGRVLDPAGIGSAR
jgi:hypothetical protein